MHLAAPGGTDSAIRQRGYRRAHRFGAPHASAALAPPRRYFYRPTIACTPGPRNLSASSLGPNRSRAARASAPAARRALACLLGQMVVAHDPRWLLDGRDVG